MCGGKVANAVFCVTLSQIIDDIRNASKQYFDIANAIDYYVVHNNPHNNQQYGAYFKTDNDSFLHFIIHLTTSLHHFRVP